MRLKHLAFSLITFISFATNETNSLHQAPNSVVSIYVEYPHYNHNGEPARAFGTGAILSDQGFIITNHHVVNQASSIAIETNNGHRAYATLVGSAQEFDLAILRIKPSANDNLKEIKYGKADQMNVGDTVYAIGTPFGFDQSVTKGVVSNLDRHISLGTQVQSFIQVDAAVNPGNSGGPLLNEKGEFIGLVTGIYGPRLQTSFNIGIALAIPVDVVMPVINQIINKGYATPGWLGVSTQSLTPELRSAFTDMSLSHGVLISDVSNKSPAAKANLQSMDIITSINGAPVQSPHHLSSLITALGQDANVEIDVVRDNKKMKTKSKIGSPGDFIPHNDFGPWGLNLAEYKYANLGGKVEHGVYIQGVDPRSPAALQGLSTGDKVITINSAEISDLNSVGTTNLNKNKPQLLKVKRGSSVFFVSI